MAPQHVSERSDRDVAARIGTLLQRAPVFDGHNDLPWALREKAGYDLDSLDIARPQPELHTDIDRLRAGGVGAQFFSVFVPGTLTPGDAVIATLEQVDCVKRIIARYGSVFRAVTCAADARAAMADGRIATLMGAEGGHSIGESLPVLRMLRELGVMYMTLTHNQNISWADAATDVENLGGLSDFGRNVVAEMNRVGMLVDLSHVAPGTMRDALQASNAPVMFSHSSCRAVCRHVRNVPDDVLHRLRDNDGIVMITFVPEFVSQECADFAVRAAAERKRLGLTPYAYEDASADMDAVAELAAWQREHPAPRATLQQVADHVEHARDIAGVRHIGIGGDYDGVPALATGLEDVSGYPNLLEELANRGWSDSDLELITCGNMLRVLQAAEQCAAGTV